VSTAKANETPRAMGISELPEDELIHYGRELGLNLTHKMGRGELLRLVRQRQELLLLLERDALLDVVVWARRPVRQSASKEELAKEIAAIRKVDFHGLSDRGLLALARLRDVEFQEGEPRDRIEGRIRAAETMWDKLIRGRRKVMGSLIGRMIDGSPPPTKEDYRFLPEDTRYNTLKQQISEEGVVGGLARRIRGVADDYIKEKLDEIEQRIDQKLDEIDMRLAEWRDREIANRLKILKFTLVASVIVALLSLGYTWLKSL